MDLILAEWLSMAVRWLHVVAGIAWIGSSFYFIHLDLSLRERDGLPAGVKGEAWQVHGGGFYQTAKYMIAPAQLPDELTWFKWEAYATWLSGFALMVLVYYLGAELFLIDKARFDLSPAQAIAISVGTLVLGWLIYEGLCRSPLRDNESALALVGYVFLVALTIAFTEIFSGRGAFIQIGALIGTIMVANVFVVIIPNQRKSVAALLRGETPDARLGAEGKQRSVHNNYLTLPVVFLMIANHYPLLFATRYNWGIVTLVLWIGPLLRHFFNERHAGRPSPWWTWAAAAALMIAIAFLSAAGPQAQTSGAAPTAVAYARVEEIVLSRCSMCHTAEPLWPGIVAAPRGITLDQTDAIRKHARLIATHAAFSDAMPPGNITDMTAEERREIATWLAAGGRSD